MSVMLGTNALIPALLFPRKRLTDGVVERPGICTPAAFINIILFLAFRNDVLNL